MKKAYIVAEVVETKEDDKTIVTVYSHSATSHNTAGEATEKARKQATRYVGDTYGVFELTGTVVHPIPELDLTPAS